MFNPFKKQEEPEELDDALYAQAVIVSFDLSSEFGSEEEQAKAYELEDQLLEAVEETEIGVVDGHEFGDDECTIYLYGKDANAVFKAAEPILKAAHFKPIRAVIREGSADDEDATTNKVVITN